MIGAYREPDRARGLELMGAPIDSVSDGIPAWLKEVRELGCTLKQRAAYMRSTSTGPAPSNGAPIHQRGLEHLRDFILGFLDLTDYSREACSSPAGSDRSYNLDVKGQRTA
ncbi:hypothetical protein [Nocardioides sp.]|uniref:hypothetical protein n=1 Tax=Nocardioides sp. TaxID=35761 RepID=UPI0019CC7629|nr:hypothetical protein [Nocardioides sp.]MBC7277497.1 hypothetical protein [Nocardioides sp.]